MIRQISTLISFLKKPQEPEHYVAGWKNKILLLANVFLINIILISFFLFIHTILEEYGLLGVEDHRLLDLFRENSTVFVFIVAGLIVPLFEEIIFRYPLKLRSNPFFWIFGLNIKVLNPKQRYRTLKKIATNWRNYYSYIFYGFLLAFAALHLTNFELSTSIIILAPIIVMPQFLTGFFASYLRLHIGFLWGFLLHSLHNITFILVFILSSGVVDTMYVETEYQKIKIEESSIFDFRSPSMDYIQDSLLVIENYLLPDILSAIKGVPSNRFIKRGAMKLEKGVKLDIYFELKDKEKDFETTFLKYLQEAYPFRYIPVDSIVEAQEIFIYDSEFLYRNLTLSRDTISSSVSTNELKVKNVNLKYFSDHLMQRFALPFVVDSTIADTARFDFYIKSKTADEFKKEIRNFGLELKRKTTTIKYWYLDKQQ